MKFSHSFHEQIVHPLFEAFVDRDNGLTPDQSCEPYKGLSQCWEWHGPSTHAGYAAMPIKNTWYTGHRISYFLHHGAITDGMVVRHRCDNKICTNPEHLELGTMSDNIKDYHQRRGFYLKDMVPKTPKTIQRKINDTMGFMGMRGFMFCPKGLDQEAIGLRQEWEASMQYLKSSMVELVKMANPRMFKSKS